jgi:hypothetical protein
MQGKAQSIRPPDNNKACLSRLFKNQPHGGVAGAADKDSHRPVDAFAGRSV